MGIESLGHSGGGVNLPVQKSLQQAHFQMVFAGDKTHEVGKHGRLMLWWWDMVEAYRAYVQQLINSLGQDINRSKRINEHYILI